jgi:general L-amino acid transport system substrate-binding protein
VKAKGFVQCGVNTGLLGFASTNDKGECGRIDIDYSKAVAAAILQRRHQGQVLAAHCHRAFLPRCNRAKWTCLSAIRLDDVARTSLGLMFVGVNYYDGQGFMVRKD